MIAQHTIVLFTTFATCIGRMNHITYSCNFSLHHCGQWSSTSSNNKWIHVYRSYSRSLNERYRESVMESTVAHRESANMESILLPPGRHKLIFTSMSLTRGTGRLRVYRKWKERLDKLKSITPKYKLRRKTIRWFDCQVPCRVVFEAYGATGSTTLHIDDVTLRLITYPATTPIVQPHEHRDRHSSPKYNETFYCNFDQNNCSHIWFSDNSDDFDWVYRNGSSLINDTGQVSEYDDRGKFMVMEARGHTSGQKARLLSKKIRPGVVALSFWYSFIADVGRLRVFKKVDTEMTVMWTGPKLNDGQSWLSENVTFRCNSACRVVFEAEGGELEHGHIAIDEILLSTIYHNTFGSNSIAVLRDVCDFEVNFCLWSQASSKSLLWERWKGATPKTNTGPLGDYTTGKGVYALFQDSTDQNNLRATMTSQVIRYPFWRELRFAYHKLQYNNQTSRLNVYKKMEATGVTELLWTSPQVEGELDWRKVNIAVNSNTRYFLVFEAVGGCCGYGDIAVDNVEITSGILPEISDCDFNNSLCEWSQSNVDDFDWLFRADDDSMPMSGPPSNGGSYLYTADSDASLNDSVAILDGPTMGPLGNASICVRFMYYMNCTHVGKLQLTASGSGEENDRLLWTRSGNQGQRWWSGYVTVPFVNDQVFRLRFKSELGSGMLGDIAIKNVITDTKPCYEDAPYDCDFTVDMCGWKHPTSAGAKWMRTTSEKSTTDTAPPADHTTGSKDGGYMIMTSTVNQPSFYVTVKTSKILCVDFWYFSYGSDRNGRLAFWTQPQNDFNETIQWSFSADVVTWHHSRVSVQSKITYKMGFLARLSDGYMAIDDITVTSGSCT